MPTFSLPLISTKSASSCSAVEVGAFEALIVKGGEVTKNGLYDRIRRAEALAFARTDGVVIGVAALKNPTDRYRSSVFKKSKVSYEAKDFPLEVGWFFVEVSYRGRGISRLLIQKLVEVADGRRIFATSRVDNKPMHRSLEKAGFTQIGCSYASEVGEHKLVLFIR